jgi:LuxR family maltose regulon positive regulatory protein
MPAEYLVLLSRADPPLPLARLRAQNQVVDIRADKLRFTLDEITGFLNEVMGLNLSASDVAAMEERTEGWIASLQLASLSMQGRKDIHSFVSAFTGSHHYIMDYLVEEVLKLQPERVRSFLLQTSILGRMCAPLCDAVVEADTPEPASGQALLEALERLGLFVIPLDDEQLNAITTFSPMCSTGVWTSLSASNSGCTAARWRNGFIPKPFTMPDGRRRIAPLLEENGCSLICAAIDHL